MYTQHWNLSLLPFENVPDARFLFASRGHREALTRVLFALKTGKILSLLSGDYGSGKTLVCRAAMQRLPPNEFKVAFVTNPRLDATDLTREIIYQLGGDAVAGSRYDVLRSFHDILARHGAAGRNCAVLIDEAQLITDPLVLEDLRLLLNTQVPGQSRFSLVLVGQTELVDVLKSVPQLRQRIGMRFHIPHLDADEVLPYMSHRLASAGGDVSVFEDEAVEAIARLSKGNPREINALADMALLFGSLKGLGRVSAAEVEAAAKERI